jgi:hypothetical protein
LLTFIKKPRNIINQFVRNDEKIGFLARNVETRAFGGEGLMLFQDSCLKEG